VTDNDELLSAADYEALFKTSAVVDSYARMFHSTYRGPEQVVTTTNELSDDLLRELEIRLVENPEFRIVVFRTSNTSVINGLLRLEARFPGRVIVQGEPASQVGNPIAEYLDSLSEGELAHTAVWLSESHYNGIAPEKGIQFLAQINSPRIKSKARETASRIAQLGLALEAARLGKVPDERVRLDLDSGRYEYLDAALNQLIERVLAGRKQIDLLLQAA
jgi:hypothetical protein